MSRFLVRVAAALTGCVVIAGCTTPAQPSSTGGSTATPTASPASPAATGSPTASVTATTGAEAPALVYFQIDGPNGVRLVREPQDVAAAAPARGAVEAMLEGPDDPDYDSPWNPATRVLGISDNAGVVTVDLSGEARTASVGSAGAAMMTQQLIWTVTEQLGTDKRVMLNIDGQPAGELWGVLAWTAPQPRGDWLETLLLVGIDTPAEGAEVASPVQVTGQAAVFEATLPWRVLTLDGDLVQQGFATTAEGNTMASYAFEVTLPPGDYVLEVSEDDPSAGEAGAMDVDDREITVTG